MHVGWGAVRCGFEAGTQAPAVLGDRDQVGWAPELWASESQSWNSGLGTRVVFLDPTCLCLGCVSKPRMMW